MEFHWRAPLARQLGITPGALQRWLTGGVPVPTTRLRQAEDLPQARIAEEAERWTQTLESLNVEDGEGPQRVHHRRRRQVAMLDEPPVGFDEAVVVRARLPSGLSLEGRDGLIVPFDGGHGIDPPR